MDFKLTKKEKEVLLEKIEKARRSTEQENTLGQWIGKIISTGTDQVLNEITKELAEECSLSIETAHQQGKNSSFLNNTLGERKQVDHTINHGDTPLIIIESKWLKDKRHLNDKGSWLLMMKDIALANTSIKGIVTILAGPWEGVKSIIQNRVIPFIYPLNSVYEILLDYGIDIPIDEERNAYADPEDSLDIYLSKIEEAAEQNKDLISELGYKLISTQKEDIKFALRELLVVDRQIDIEEIETIITSNHGHLIRRVHNNIQEAHEWLRRAEDDFPSVIKANSDGQIKLL